MLRERWPNVYSLKSILVMSSQIPITTIISALAEEIESHSKISFIEYLYRHRLLDCRAIERRVIRREVARLYESGMGRCDAMVLVADKMGCSYEKVRALIYQKN